jgi:dipeptidyl aminopeptidase/acylaminoacyl peptidase
MHSVLCLAALLPVAQISSLELSGKGAQALFLEAQAPGVFEAYIVPVDGSLPARKVNAPLVEGGSVLALRFALDDTRVVYAAEAEALNRVELFSVSNAMGSVPVRLHPSFPSNHELASLGGRLFSLAGEGARVVYAVDTGGISSRIELYSVPADASALPTRLSGELVPGGSVSAYEVSPDGNQIVFVADALTNNVQDAFRVPIDGSSEPELLSTAGGQVNRVWISPDSTRVVYTAPNVFSVAMDGSQTPLALGSETGVSDCRITADSARVVYRNLTQLRSAPLDGSAPALVLTDALVDVFDVSSDGQFVVFVTEAFPLEAVVLASQRTDGSAPPEILTVSSSPIGLLRISPSSRRVVFSWGDLAQDLSAVDIEGAEPRYPLGSHDVNDFRFVPGRDHVLFARDTFPPTQAQWFHVPASGAVPAQPFLEAVGRFLHVSGDRPKRSLRPATGGGPSRTGLFFYAVPEANGREGLFVRPWDGQSLPVRLNS